MMGAFKAPFPAREERWARRTLFSLQSWSCARSEVLGPREAGRRQHPQFPVCIAPETAAAKGGGKSPRGTKGLQISSLTNTLSALSQTFWPSSRAGDHTTALLCGNWKSSSRV